MPYDMPLKVAQIIYKVIDDALEMHKAIGDGLVSSVVWHKGIPTLSGGDDCMDTLLKKGTYSAPERDKIIENQERWNSTYAQLEQQVFYRESLHVMPSEKLN